MACQEMRKVFMTFHLRDDRGTSATIDAYEIQQFNEAVEDGVVVGSDLWLKGVGHHLKLKESPDDIIKMLREAQR